MLLLARRLLFHDRVRFFVTLTGVVFAVVLISIEMGLFCGFAYTTSSLIDNSGAHLWIMSRHVPYVEQGVPFNARKVFQVKAIAGIAKAEDIIVAWAQWKHPDGRRESILVIGSNPETNFVQPWNLVEGRLADLGGPDAVIVDDLYKRKLGISRVGETFEINGQRVT